MADAKTKELRSSSSQALIKPQQWSVAATGLAMLPVDDISAGYHQRLQDDYQKDSYCKKLLAKLASSASSADSFVKNFSKSPNGLILFNNLVFVPHRSKVKLDILRDCHDSPTSGHQGQAKTLELISRSYYWPSLRSTVDNYVRTCEACNRSKSARHRPYGQLQPLPIPDRPWKSISMDFIVKLPPSSDASSQTKYDSIWVVVDRFTKMAHFVPCREAMHASDLANLFIQHIFAQHGLPEEIISDRGSLFTSSFIKSLCQLAKVDQRLSTAYHPQTDGQTERVNQVLEQYLRVYTNYLQDNWVELLPFASFAYNNSEHSSTKTTPFYANYGYHPTCTVTVQSTKAPAAGERLQYLQQLQQTLRQELLRSQTFMAHYHNRHTSQQPDYKVGDHVWLLTRHINTTRPSHKLDYKKIGPFTITKIIGPTSFQLHLPPQMKIHPVFHVSLLEPVATSPDVVRHQERPPPPVIVDEQEEYQVESILDSRRRRNKWELLVHWHGYPASERTWEPAANLKNVQALDDFKRRYPSKVPKELSQ